MRRSLLPLLAAAGLCLPARALAEDTGPPPEAPVKVTIFLLPHPEVQEDVTIQIIKNLEAGLKKNPRLEYKDLDSRLAEFAQELPQDQIDAARASLKDGQEALLNLDVPKAIQKLQDSVEGLAKVLPYIKKQELADAMASLAVAYYEGGDKKSGRDTFVRLLTWRNDYLYPVDKLPPKYQAMFDDAQKIVDKAGRGGLDITSEPPGAQAYIDGKSIGITPCSVDQQPAGEHFITLKKEGFKKAVAPAMVVGKKQSKLAVELSQSDKYLLVSQAIDKVAPTLGQDFCDPDSENLKSVLFVEHAVFMRVKAAGPGALSIETWLYDLRTRHKLTVVTKTVQKAQLDAQLEPLAGNIYLNVNYEPILEKPKDDLPKQQLARKPIYKTWWFWTGVGVVAAVAVLVPVAIVETRPPKCPDGAGCLQLSAGLFTFR